MSSRVSSLFRGRRSNDRRNRSRVPLNDEFGDLENNHESLETIMEESDNNPNDNANFNVTVVSTEAATTPNATTFNVTDTTRATDNDGDEDDPAVTSTDNNNNNTNDDNHVNNNDISPEEQLRRREALFLLVLLFLLLKIWIYALETGDPGWLVLSVLGTYWLIRRRQAAERRQRRQVRPEVPPFLASADTELVLNYQAQLTAAIWESRMLAVMGGISESPERDETQGVSERSRAQWQRYEQDGDGNMIKCSTSETHDLALEETKASAVTNITSKSLQEDDRTCSICLCEYEPGETIVQLPCGHLYHDNCISSWTRNHVRCPLCNYDLESAGEEDSTSNAATATVTSSSSLEVV